VALLLHEPPDQADPVIFVVDGELAGEAQQLGLPAEQPRRERVEGADPKAGGVPVEQTADALLHLARCLVGECHREDPLRGDPVPVDEGRYPHGEHPRLAGAGAGQHQERPLDVLHRLSLGGIESQLQLG
jgi:hypothetical protein